MRISLLEDGLFVSINKYAFLLQNPLIFLLPFLISHDFINLSSISSTSSGSNQSGSASRSSRRQSPRSISPRGRSSSSRIRELCSTGAVAKRLSFVGSGEGAGGFWNRGISARAVCDGAALIFRNKPLVVIGGGDSAMEKVYIIHRCDTFKASKIMRPRALSKPKIEVIWNSVVEMRTGKVCLVV